MKILFALLTIPPFISFSQKNIQPDSISTRVLDQIIVTASKQKERLLQAPVSIEVLDTKAINQSAQSSFFEAIQGLKGIQVITPSLGFKVINARGFANTTNVRFVQMVDGADNQAPHIGAPIGNSLGPNDLDILKVEIIPGSSSAIYGMNAINGIANFITKDPFLFEGTSFNQKVGFNNIYAENTKATLFQESNIRLAKALNQKFAFKINATFTKGTDWQANNKLDLNPSANVSTNLVNEYNPGADRVNIYGDEQSNRKTLTLAGKQYSVSRTGYAEKEVADYGLKNLKADISLFFRPNINTEFSYVFRMANQNNIYQRTNRFRFDNYSTQQHVLNFSTKGIQFKSFITAENTGNAYNIRSMAENIDRSFKTDAIWFADFTKQFNTDIAANKSIPEAMQDARNMADKGRFQSHTPAFNAKIDELRQINNWDIGAALKVQSKLFHTEFQHDITNDILSSLSKYHKLKIMYGLDYRNYNIVPDGNYFINPTDAGKNLNYWKVGSFLQVNKWLFHDKLKINAVARLDKNQYYNAKLNPRLALVYSPTAYHNFRASVQSGYRFPSIFEAFSNINSGGRKRIGGLPVMSQGIFENSYTQASITTFQAVVQNDINKNALKLADAIAKNKDLLQKNTYTYLQPEKVNSFEFGYRAVLLEQKLKIDFDLYFNNYRNLMAQIDANVPKSNGGDLAANLQNTSLQDRYRLWTNSKTISYNSGSSMGVTYILPQNFIILANATYSKLNRKEQNDGLEDGFNTPKWAYNLSLGNSKIFKNIGFNINLKHQDAFLWQSALATGTVSAYTTIDAQISTEIIKNKLGLKLGGTNLANKYYYSYLGGSNIGGFYYISLTLNL